MRAELRICKRTPKRNELLALAFATTVALPAHVAFAGTHVVGNCSDAAAGSLRAVIGDSATQSGDTIDMTGLSCSTISLQTGITISQEKLTINGPGQNALTITRASGSGKHRIFRELSYYNALTLTDMTLTGGNVDETNTPPSQGGCIYLPGLLVLNHVTVANCTASGVNSASGGGIWAGTATLHHSIVSGNSASISNQVVPHYARGGGIYVSSVLNTTYTTIKNNSINAGVRGRGGGIYGSYGGSVDTTTISGNHVDGIAGAVFLAARLHLRDEIFTISNSTISGNEATFLTGGIYSYASLTIANSTIADNTATFSEVPLQSGSRFIGTGVQVSAVEFSLEFTMQSSIVANNSYGSDGIDSDFSSYSKGLNTAVVSGSNNVIRRTSGPSTPGGTSGACPLLGSLRDNGGETHTIALLSRSVGIDEGNNQMGLMFDQRGASYKRVVGASADVGAYEIQKDSIFVTNFEGCAPLPSS